MGNLLPIVLLIASAGIFFGYVNPTYTGQTGSVLDSGKSIQELIAEEGQYNDALTKTQEIETVRSGLLTKYNALSDSDKDRIAKLLPDNIDSVRLIIDINTLAAQFGLSLKNISVAGNGSGSGAKGGAQATGAPGAAASGPGAGGTASVQPAGGGAYTQIGPSQDTYTPVTLSFSVSGDYDTFLQFLKQLEQSLRILDITSLNLSTSGSSSGGVSGTISSGGSAGTYGYTLAIKTYHLK